MADLAHVLRHLPRPQDPDLLVGENPADDAAVYRIAPDLALVQSVDFFTPVVDDPYTYGRIAAANSLSDIYAMGGTPRIALNIAAFPVKSQPLEILGEILRGGADTAAEAGVTIVGGHTVDDEEPKYGLAVTGTVDSGSMVTARGAQAGDALLLTKPIGTGTISTAVKAGSVQPAALEQAVRWMTMLNRDAALAMKRTGVHAATDITGFGLIGHLVDFCRAGSVSATISSRAVPQLPFALESIRGGSVPAGTFTNLEAVNGSVDWGGTDEDMRLLLADPQTSGGLLVALPNERVAQFQQAAGAAMLTVQIGRIEAAPEGHIAVER